MQKNFLLIAAILGFLGVAFGAFGAHGLRNRLSPDMLSVFEIGVRYQMYHVFALLAVAAAIGHFGQVRLLYIAGWSFPGRYSDFLGKPLRAGADRNRDVRRDYADRRSRAPHWLGRVWRSSRLLSNRFYVFTAETLGRRVRSLKTFLSASASLRWDIEVFLLGRLDAAAAANEDLGRIPLSHRPHAR
jgi:hypothetical protein